MLLVTYLQHASKGDNRTLGGLTFTLTVVLGLFITT